MQVAVTFRHMPPSEALRGYAAEKLTHVVEKYFRADDLEAHVVLSVERYWHIADFTIGFKAMTVKVEERSEDMYSSIDLAMDKIERQLRRYKERLKHHHGQDRVHHRQDLVNNLKVRHDVVEMPEGIPEANESPTRVIKSNDLLVKRLNVDEAIMQMDLMNNDFLVFTNVATAEMNVVYRRKDGHYGLIEASGVNNARKAAS